GLMNGIVFTEVGGTFFEWKNRPNALKGSTKFQEMFQAFSPWLSGVLNPVRNRCVSEFHSIGMSSTSSPTSLRFFCTSSFIASGNICPDPDVEIRWTAFAGCLLPSKPACFRSSFALAGSYSYVSFGWPNHGWPLYTTPVAGTHVSFRRFL